MGQNFSNAASDYMPGFGNDFETESLEGALPQGQNSPQNCAYGLYAEQLSGSPFTAPRGENERSWLYRMRPSVRHSANFTKLDMPFWASAPNVDDHDLPISQLRWSPAPMPEEKLTFISGIRIMTTAGDVNTQTGMAAGLYFVTADMVDEVFYNSDGELLVVPQEGKLMFFTELGKMQIGPGEIAIIPRGMKFRVELVGAEKARGYICENYGGKFTLPDRGPIGANCLANPRDFKTPVAAFEESDESCKLTVKWCGKFYQCELGHSPLDVVAWHGNYAPFKYDLNTFSPVGAIRFDHPDPSIFTVLTAPSEVPGTANIDFVIFPERWLVGENTFRPPWYHMNIMSEFMGNIMGEYDAKPDGFAPGAVSLHNCMLPHGPDNEAYEKATKSNLAPHKLTDTLAFMFETRFPQHLTKYASELETLQQDYPQCWDGLKKNFNGKR